MGRGAFLRELVVLRHEGLPVAVHVESGSFYALSTRLADALGAEPVGELPLTTPTRGERPLAPELEREVEEDLLWLERLGFTPGARRPQRELSAVTLHLAHGCNFSCTYCCVGPSGLYGGRSFKLMPPAVVGAAIDALVARSTRPGLEVAFFGGEPLLNWEGLVHAVRHAEATRPARRWRFRAVTNGSLVTPERAAFLAEHDVWCLITLSGDARSHDLHRKTLGGGSTWELVTAGIEHLRRAGARYHLQAVVTEAMLRARPDLTLATARAELEAWSDPRDGFSAKLEDTFALSSEGLALETGACRSTAREALGGALLRGQVGVNYLDAILQGARRGPSTCGAATEGVDVLPDGTVHVCHATAAARAPDYSLGNVRAGDVRGGDLDDERWSAIRARFGEVASPCASCWARAVCPRDCHVARGREGSIPPGLCRLHQTGLLEGARVAGGLTREALRAFYDDPGGDPHPLDLAVAQRARAWSVARHLRPLWMFPGAPRRPARRLPTLDEEGVTACRATA